MRSADNRPATPCATCGKDTAGDLYEDRADGTGTDFFCSRACYDGEEEAITS